MEGKEGSTFRAFDEVRASVTDGFGLLGALKSETNRNKTVAVSKHWDTNVYLIGATHATFFEVSGTAGGRGDTLFGAVKNDFKEDCVKIIYVYDYVFWINGTWVKWDTVISFFGLITADCSMEVEGFFLLNTNLKRRVI